MKRTLHQNRFFVFTLVIATGSFLAVHHVSADAWWGKGYKTPAWVLANGGTMIISTTVGSKPNNIKGFLRQGGKYVEVEFGSVMKFDDAKNGVYTISYYNCNKDCRYQLTDNKTKLRGNDSLKTTITVVARPGQTVNITYNSDTNSAAISGAAGRIAPVKPQPTVEELIQAAAKKDEGAVDSLSRLHPYFEEAHGTGTQTSQVQTLSKQTYFVF